MHDILIRFFEDFQICGIIYANIMSQAAVKQTFGECARTMMKQSEIMV